MSSYFEAGVGSCRSPHRTSDEKGLEPWRVAFFGIWQASDPELTSPTFWHRFLVLPAAVDSVAICASDHDGPAKTCPPTRSTEDEQIPAPDPIRLVRHMIDPRTGNCAFNFGTLVTTRSLDGYP
jgi:hypothetical protein